LAQALVFFCLHSVCTHQRAGTRGFYEGDSDEAILHRW